MNINGVWVGWGLGDNSTRDDTVRRAKKFMRSMYASYAGGLADTNLYDQQMEDTVKTMQGRLLASGKLHVGGFILGVLDLPTQYAMGFKKKPLPWGISVEGHSSNMWLGPCADTFTQLAGEGLCYHQPTGYDNGAIPFDNQDGVNALADNINKVPVNIDIHAAGFSQGMIIWFDYLSQYGIPKNLKSCLWYGNPCRQLNSVADWARGLVKNPNTHGLDPLRRFAKTGSPDAAKLNVFVDLEAAGIPFVDVWREGDIFTESGDDVESQIKAAVYQMVARGLGTVIQNNPYSIASILADTFQKPLQYVMGIIMSIFSGLGFIANQANNPHYSPYNISGGVNWMRQNLQKSLAL